VKLIHP